MDAMDDGHGDVPFTLPRMGRAEGNQEAEECEISSGTGFRAPDPRCEVAAAYCGEGGGSPVQLRRTGGGLTGRPRTGWRRRTGFRAPDRR
jgi:hypothetical protein